MDHSLCNRVEKVRRGVLKNQMNSLEETELLRPKTLFLCRFTFSFITGYYLLSAPKR